MITCEICGHELQPLGQLGTMPWFRCRGCGMDYSQRREERELRRTTVTTREEQ